MNNLLLYSSLIVLFLWSGVAVQGEDDAVGSIKRSEAAQGVAKERTETIKAEMTSLGDHPWAGEYYEGDGRGVNRRLIIAPKAGFVFTWHGCLGLYDLNYGDIVQENGEIRLTFTYQNTQQGFQGLPEKFTPVRWGKRVFLVPTDKMIDFCNNINNGGHIFHLLRVETGDTPSPRANPPVESGLPDVPEKFRPYLLATPVEATIITVAKTTEKPGQYISQKTTPITLDKGKNAGLLPGMTLSIVRPDQVYLVGATITIDKIAETTSEATLKQDIKGPVPEPGWLVSTRHRWAGPLSKDQKKTEPLPPPAAK